MLFVNCDKGSVPVIPEGERPVSGNDTLIYPVVTGKKDGNTYTYLALGDSYTIGQSVAVKSNFPHQTVSLLKKQGWDVCEPNIIAVTGWTTDNLESAIQTRSPSADYDVASLLIGVNDQYVGYSLEHYRLGFEQLLKQAIGFARGKAGHVVVLSIPDWGVTPFAAGRDRDAIAKEIDAFNEVNHKISRQYNVHYINITPDTRQMANNPMLVASDGLHHSGDEYLVWSKKLATIMNGIFHE
jgi:lysophospholipase L1-like esterase